MEGRVNEALSMLSEEKTFEAMTRKPAPESRPPKMRARVDSGLQGSPKHKNVRPNTAPARAASPEKKGKRSSAEDELSAWGEEGRAAEKARRSQGGGPTSTSSRAASALHAVPEEQSFVQYREDQDDDSTFGARLVDLESFFVGALAPFSAPAAAGRRTPLYSRPQTNASQGALTETSDDLATELERMVWASLNSAESGVTFQGSLSPRAGARSQSTVPADVTIGGWNAMSLRAGTAPEGTRRELPRSVTFGGSRSSDAPTVAARRPRVSAGESAGGGTGILSMVRQNQRRVMDGRPVLHAIPSQGPLDGTEAPEGSEFDLGADDEYEEGISRASTPGDALAPARASSGWKDVAAHDTGVVNWREPIFRKSMGMDMGMLLPAELAVQSSSDSLLQTDALERVARGYDGPAEGARKARAGIVGSVVSAVKAEQQSTTEAQAIFAEAPASILRGTSKWQEAAIVPASVVERPAWGQRTAEKSAKRAHPVLSDPSQPVGGPVDETEVRRLEQEIEDEYTGVVRTTSEVRPKSESKRRLLTDHELMLIYGERITSIIDEAVVVLKLEHQKQIESMEQLFELRLVEINGAWNGRVRGLEKEVRELMKKLQVVRPQSSNTARDNYRQKVTTPKAELEGNIARLDNLLVGDGFQEAPDQLMRDLASLRRAAEEDRRELGRIVRSRNEQREEQRQGATDALGRWNDYTSAGSAWPPAEVVEEQDPEPVASAGAGAETDYIEWPPELGGPPVVRRSTVMASSSVPVTTPISRASMGPVPSHLVLLPETSQGETAASSPRSQEGHRAGPHVDLSVRTASTPKSEEVMARIRRNLSTGMGRAVQEEHRRRGSVLLAEDHAVQMQMGDLKELADKVTAKEGKKRHNSVTFGPGPPGGEDPAAAAAAAAAMFLAEGGQKSPSASGSSTPVRIDRLTGKSPPRPRSRFASPSPNLAVPEEGADKTPSPLGLPAASAGASDRATGPAPELSFFDADVHSSARTRYGSPGRGAAFEFEPPAGGASSSASPSIGRPRSPRRDQQDAPSSPRAIANPAIDVDYSPWIEGTELDAATPSASRAAGFERDPPVPSPAPAAKRPPTGPSTTATSRPEASGGVFISRGYPSSAAAPGPSVSAPSTRATSAGPAQTSAPRPTSALMVKNVYSSESVLAPTMAGARPATATATLARKGAHLVQGLVFEAFTQEVANTAKPPIIGHQRPRSGFKGDASSAVPSYYAIRQQAEFKTMAFVYPSAPTVDRGLPGKKITSKNVLQPTSTAFIKPSTMVSIPLNARPGSGAGGVAFGSSAKSKDVKDGKGGGKWGF